MPLLPFTGLALALALVPAASGRGDRIVVIEASEAGRPDLRAQADALLARSEGLRERDMTVFARVAGGSAERLYGDAAAAPAGPGGRARFVVLLYGKDGGEKLRSEAVVSAEDLFRLIDTMPMRRQEMRRQPD